MVAALYICASKPRMKSWIKRLGVGAFLFFLIKGLAWLALIWLGFDILAGC
jgi:hypothetical protein